MSRDTRNPRVDQDGVSVSENSGDRRVPLAPFLVIAVLAVVALGAIAAWYLFREPGTQTALEASMPPVAEQRVAGRAAVPVLLHPLRRPAEHVDKVVKPARPTRISNRPADRPQANPGRESVQAPTLNAGAAEEQHGQLESLARDIIEGLRASGETGGLAAFPPPGTNPVKTGLVVPDDFELPEGYVRYYQTTDEGRRLKPVLMFSPDYQFVDADGKPITVPKDGIVPPEMAPPGLPVRMLEVPEAARPASAGTPGHGG
jgi:hypothetical protein